ncbi:NAD(P)-dependent oxidoreductase [Methanococcoides sp. SA1]|nr:NAD(P)-dependent oxidoreductase [Methanococcoides sp. SA1]
MNILITGFEGFIGNALVGKLKDPENTVVGFGRGQNLKRKMINIPDVIINGDMRDLDLLRRVITDYEIDEIYHLASQSIIKKCSNDPYTSFDVNIMGAAALLEACRTSGQEIKSIVISTSDKAFGHASLPYTEKTPVNPLYVYETSKTCQQFLTLCYFHNFGLPTKVVACSNIYGPGDLNMSRIVPNTITRLAKNKSAQLNSGVKNFIREFVYIDDATDAFIKVSKFGKPGEVYCCGGTEYLTIESFIKKICTLMNKDFDKNVGTFVKPSQFKEIEEQYIDATKLKSIGWSPRVSLEEGLKKSIEFYTNLVRNN